LAFAEEESELNCAESTPYSQLSEVCILRSRVDALVMCFAVMTMVYKLPGDADWCFRWDECKDISMDV